MSELSKIANEAYLANLRSSVNEQVKIPDVPKVIPLAADPLGSGATLNHPAVKKLNKFYVSPANDPYWVKMESSQGKKKGPAWRSESSLRSPSPRHAHLSEPE